MDLEQAIRDAVIRALRDRTVPPAEGLAVPVGVSARHVHLSEEDVQRLFGQGHRLHPAKELQPGQFACEEMVTLVGPKGVIKGVRVLGPARGRTQVEVSATDCIALGIPAVTRLSGDVAGTPGIALVGPKGAFGLAEGVIVAKRHIHITPAEADRWHLTHGQVVQVAVEGGDRPLIFGQVVVRTGEQFRLEMHIDTDEANAAGLRTGDRCRVLPTQEGSR